MSSPHKVVRPPISLMCYFLLQLGERGKRRLLISCAICAMEPVIDIIPKQRTSILALAGELTYLY